MPLYPTSLTKLQHLVINYGSFKTELDYLVNLLKSDSSTSVIVGGNTGVGKRTLIEQLELKTAKDDVIFIYLHPLHFEDDFAALKYIAHRLAIRVKTSLQEVLEDIEKRLHLNANRIVFVLERFEEFCRQKQSLLYNLTNLTQHGSRINLIGLTTSLDCTEELEKRVRSRLNALFRELRTPYTNKAEYLEFAALLLGLSNQKKLDADLRRQLEYMYLCGNSSSIRALKRQLASVMQGPSSKPALDDRHGVLRDEAPAVVEAAAAVEAEAVPASSRKPTRQSVSSRLRSRSCGVKEMTAVAAASAAAGAKSRQDLNSTVTVMSGVKLRNVCDSIPYLEQILRSLTQQQRNMIILAMSYCHKNETRDFSLKNLHDYAQIVNLSSFNMLDSSAFQDLLLLAQVRLLRPHKPHRRPGRNSKYTPGLTSKELRYLMLRNSDFSTIKVEPLWRSL